MAFVGSSVVYFIRPVGERGPVKIGCAATATERLTDLNRWSPLRLELAATIPGRQPLEGRFHAKFLHQRSHGEWFHASDELDAVIDAIRAGTFDVTTLPEGKRLPNAVQMKRAA